MWNIKNNKNESICKIETQTEYKLTFTKEREKGEGTNQEYGIQTILHKIDKQQGITVIQVFQWPTY